MKISDNGIKLIKEFEGVRDVVYLDPIGVPTVGVGHTKGITKAMVGKKISQAQIDAYLREDLATAENAVNSIGQSFNQNQFDSLTSFTFNCGVGNLRKLCKNRNKVEIGNALMLYNKAGGKELAGLTRRRKAEKTIYFTPCDNSSNGDGNPYQMPKIGVLKKGSKGVGVKWLQWELNRYGNNLAVDGFFGAKTENALKVYQTGAKITVDGKCGAQTRKSLTSN